MGKRNQREEQLKRLHLALSRIAGSSFRGRDLALEDLKWHAQVSLSPAVMPVLDRLLGNPMRLTELANLLQVSAPAVSRQVQILLSKGLVERTQDENDARAMIVRLTPMGVEVATEAENRKMDLLRRILAQWSDEDLDQMAPVLDRLAGELEKWDHR